MVKEKNRTRDHTGSYWNGGCLNVQLFKLGFSAEHGSDLWGPIKSLILSFCKLVLFTVREGWSVLSSLPYRVLWWFLPGPWELQSFSVNFGSDISLSLMRHLKLCQSGALCFLYLISQLWVCVFHSATQFGVVMSILAKTLEHLHNWEILMETYKLLFTN